MTGVLGGVARAVRVLCGDHRDGSARGTPALGSVYKLKRELRDVAEEHGGQARGDPPHDPRAGSSLRVQVQGGSASGGHKRHALDWYKRTVDEREREIDEDYDTMRSLRYARVSPNHSLIDRFQPRTLVALILLR